MEIKARCIDETTEKLIVCEEHKRKIVFINDKHSLVKKIEIDGCQITDGLRCDYLVMYDKIQNFIELKGKDLNHAFKQLIRSLELLGKGDFTKNCYVITSRSPLSSAQIQNQRIIFKRKYKTYLDVKNNVLHVKI